jgi:hypothetical protein
MQRTSEEERRFIEAALIQKASQGQDWGKGVSVPRIRKKWVPPGSNIAMGDGQAARTFIGAWHMMTPLPSWTSPLQNQPNCKTVPNLASIDAIITRLRTPYREAPRKPPIRVHATHPPVALLASMGSTAHLKNQQRAQNKRPPSPLAAAWRSAPNLSKMDKGSAHHRSAPQLTSRKLPDGATSKLLPDHMRRELIEYARSQEKELVLLVEMRPVKTQTLHQVEDKYRQFASALAAELGEHLFSKRRPELAAFTAITVELPSDAFKAPPSNAGSSGSSGGASGGDAAAAAAMAAYLNPAFDDFRAAEGFVASNCSTLSAPPLRFGAFEVYLVAKLPRMAFGAERGGSGRGGGSGSGSAAAQEDSFHVELLFSKLFSRCWPNVANVIKKIRQHPAVMMEMVRREDAFVFEQARREGEADGPAGVRSALDQMQEPLTSVVHETGSLHSNSTIDAATKLLADLDAGDAALRQAMKSGSLEALDTELDRFGKVPGTTASRSVVQEARNRREAWILERPPPQPTAAAPPLQVKAEAEGVPQPAASSLPSSLPTAATRPDKPPTAAPTTTSMAAPAKPPTTTPAEAPVPSTTPTTTPTTTPKPQRSISWVEAAEEDERAALALEAEQEAEGQPAERSQFLRSDAEWADDLDGHDDELDDYVAAAARR